MKWIKLELATSGKEGGKTLRINMHYLISATVHEKPNAVDLLFAVPERGGGPHRKNLHENGLAEGEYDRLLAALEMLA